MSADKKRDVRVAAVVVTRNRKEELALNLEALYEQSLPISRIIVVDNDSSDGTLDYLKQQTAIHENLTIITMGKNTGGAGGFYEGMKRAIHEDAAYIWLMDDDGRPLNVHALADLVAHAQKVTETNSLIMLNSMVVSGEDSTSFLFAGGRDSVQEFMAIADEGVVSNHVSPFNGTLVSDALVRKIGFPNPDFFIKGDEFDYVRRARAANAHIATICSSLFYHPQVPRMNRKMFGKSRTCYVEAPWKEYYRTRNRTYLYKTESDYAKCLMYVIKRLMDILVLSDEKGEASKMVFRGFYDGLRGNMGQTVIPQ